MITVRYTCSDAISAMVRDYVVLSLQSNEDATSPETWTRVKRLFARRHKTKSSYVDITALEYLKKG